MDRYLLIDQCLSKEDIRALLLEHNSLNIAVARGMEEDQAVWAKVGRGIRNDPRARIRRRQGKGCRRGARHRETIALANDDPPGSLDLLNNEHVRRILIRLNHKDGVHREGHDRSTRFGWRDDAKDRDERDRYRFQDFHIAEITFHGANQRRIQF